MQSRPSRASVLDMNRFVIAFVVAAAFAGAACKSKKQDTTPPTGGSGEPAAVNVAPDPNVKMELGEMKIVDVNKNKAVLVHANGEIEYEGQVGAKVTAQGQIVNDKGEVGFTLLADGTIKGPDGKIVNVMLTAEGAIKSGDKSVSIADDGSLSGANPEAPPMKIEGATTVGLKRTALFVLIVLTTPDEPPPVAPTPTTQTK